MSRADEIYNELILDIYNNGVWDKDGDVRTVYEDGTPAYSKSIFGKQVVFEEGEIPLLTTKHTGWKTAFKEMKLFWINQTVKQEDFNNENVKVWDEWFLENGTLGKSYAYQFESRPKKEIVKVKKKESACSPFFELKDLKVKDLIPVNKGEFPLGYTFTSNFGDEYVVLEVYKSGIYHKKSKSAKIQFLKTGSIKIYPMDAVKVGRVDDNYRRSYRGIGYLGDYKKVEGYSEEEFKILKNKWSRMLERCYHKDCSLYHLYGGKGVFVDERWHSLENFLNDLRYIPQFFIAKYENFESWSIDKDYFGSNCYSKDTCVWLTHQENCLYRSFNKPFYSIDKNNNKKIHISITDAVKELQLNNSAISNISECLNGKHGRSVVGGYKFEYLNSEEDFLYRYKLSNNQVVDLINNIKNNPLSRRLMTSFWNDADVKEKALQECAMQTTWNVRNGKLDLLLYSRSVDSALGLPYNWIQYWFLLQLVAKSTGLKVGKFIHQMGNVHYYDRHEDTLINQIKSQQFNQPAFKFTSDNTEFFNFKLEDVIIEDYINGGKFEYEVAI